MSNPTSNFGWVMPDPTDLVTNLPADFQVFGQAVDTSMADLKGGTTGQILSKATATDMDFTWITNDVGDITAVNVTAPITGGGSSGAVTIGVSAASTSASGVSQLTDSVITTSSVLAATATAVKSANDTALKSVQPSSYVANRIYQSPITTAAASITATVTQTYYAPIYIRENVTMTGISILTGASFSGSGSVRLGIYNNSGFTPTTVLLDAGTVAPIAASAIYQITISQALTTGWYWLAFNSITGATTNQFTGWTTQTGVSSYDMGKSVVNGASLLGYTQLVNATSGFATATGVSGSTTISQIGLKAS